VQDVARYSVPATGTLPDPAADLAIWEDDLQESVRSDTTITETEKESVVLARRGQGLFRQRVCTLEKRCRITGAANPRSARADLRFLGLTDVAALSNENTSHKIR
jgi:putative restriction endonuclease